MPDISHKLTIREPVSSDEFRAYYELRWRILRAPWNQPRGSERDRHDADGSHLMAITGDRHIVGVGRVHFNSIREAQIRYMAIDTAWQRRGIGSSLLQALETRARKLGAATLLLDARESAVGFYLKHGYRATGSGHVLFNSIAHMHMRKQLE